MTECERGRACMTEQVQWSTILVALFVVLLIGLGIWLIVKQIIEEDITGAQQRDIEEFTEDMYLSSTLPEVELHSDRLKSKDPK